MKIDITLNKGLLDDKDIDFFHWDCGYELAKCDEGTWRIDSLGEVECCYKDEEKGIEEWDYSDIVNYYVRNNKEYIKALETGKLYLNYNNWFSIEFFDNNGYFIENSDFTDSVYSSISEALEDFKKYVKEKECD